MSERPVDRRAATGHHRVERSFGPVTYRFVGISERRMAQHQAWASYADSVVPDEPAAEPARLAAAAFPVGQAAVAAVPAAVPGQPQPGGPPPCRPGAGSGGQAVSRAAAPRVPLLAGNGAGVWVVLLIGWGLAAAAWLAWLAARIAAALSGRRMPPFSERWVISLARWRTGQAWPGTPTILVALIAAVLACAVITAGVIVWRIIAARIPRPGDPVAALSGDPQITPLTPVPAAKTAIRLRPSLAGSNPRSLPAADTGLLLGDLKRPSGRGPALFASWEDTITAFMAPRSGKTTALSIPYVLSAPGAVVATSNKADLWAATAQLRAASGSTVWLFDPQRITGSRQRWWWNPLAGLATVEAAHRLAAHFVLTVDDNTKRDLSGPAAQDLLCALFLAAASSGRSLRECGRWLADAGSPIPAELLAAAGFGAWPPACAARRTAHRKPATASTRPPAPRRNASTTRTSWRGSRRRAAKTCRRSTRPGSRPAVTPCTC